MSDDELAAFQGTFLDVLAECDDPARVGDALRARLPAGPLLDWVNAAEPRMLAVAWALVRRWGRTDGAVASDRPLG